MQQPENDTIPTLSIILVTPTSLSRLEKTLLALQTQTIRERLEIILIVPAAEAAGHDPDGLLNGFQNVQVVPIGPITDVTTAGAHGVPHSSAAIVAFVEDHAYPAPDWAESIAGVYQGQWAAVGCAMTSANPESLWGWASQLISYGPYTAPVQGGQVGMLPTHDVSYQRDSLLALDQPLEQLMTGWGGDLNDALRDKGFDLYLDAGTLIYHRNTTVVKELLDMALISGRYYAGRRWQKEQWSFGRRLLYVLASPLIPFKRGYQLWQEAFQGKDRSDIMPAVWLPLAALIVVDALGQLLGFLTDEGDAAAQMAHHELIDRLTIS